MKRFINKPYWWAIIYTLMLTGFAAFVVLDTFVIPRAIRTVPDVSYVQNGNATATTTVTSAADTSDVSVVTDSASSGENNQAASAAASGVYTTNSYKDENISIIITTQRIYNTQVYIADIQLKSIAYLKTALAQNIFGRNITQTTSTMAQAHDAIFAINGDYYGFQNYGFVIRNGVLYRSVARSGDEALVIYQDGSFEVVSENAVSASTLLKQGAVQVFSFGPSLLSNGEINVSENSEVAQAKTSNPRTAIGIISPLHYILIVSDGRTSASAGLTLYQLAAIFKEQGCKIAYNFDGGGSSTMWFNGKIVNVPTDGSKIGERKISDIVYVGY